MKKVRLIVVAACCALLAFSTSGFAAKDPEIEAQIKALKQLLKITKDKDQKEAIKQQIKLLQASASQ